ncbi:hypothetical protein V6N11_075177 [Hibiscus sabdariffa]|uniref:Uncharacterized protein n=1 Tax=Hibiscus sabdariffa TaxID=183260 RepID=A0ABR2R5R4_9ROSI
MATIIETYEANTRIMKQNSEMLQEILRQVKSLAAHLGIVDEGEINDAKEVLDRLPTTIDSEVDKQPIESSDDPSMFRLLVMERMVDLCQKFHQDRVEIKGNGQADSSISQEFKEFNPGTVLIVGQQKKFKGKKRVPATKEGSKLDKSEDEKQKNEALKEKFEHPGKEWEGGVLTTLETLVALDFLVLGEGYNRQSLSIGHAEVEGLSRITTVVPGTNDSISKLVQQLYKLVDMHEVVDVSDHTVTLEVTPQRLLDPYGICERQAKKDKNTSLLDGLHIICIIHGSMTVAIVYDLNKKATRKMEGREEAAGTKLGDGVVNTAGFVCTCAGHSSAEGQGQAQVGATGHSQNQWYVDSGATHHVTPEAGKVVQGTEYAGPGTQGVGASQALRQASDCQSSELELVGEIDKLRQVIAASGGVSQSDVRHGGDVVPHVGQETSVQEGADVENPADGFETAEGGLENCHRVETEYETEGGNTDVIASAQEGADVKNPADGFETAEGGLENCHRVETEYGQHGIEGGNTDVTASAQEGTDAENSAEGFETAEGGQENSGGAECEQLSADEGLSQFDVRHECDVVADTVREASAQEGAGVEYSAGELDLADSAGCVRVQGCWAVKELLYV